MAEANDDELRLIVLKLARRIRSNRARDDLSDSQMSVLVHLESSGDLTPGRLAELEHVTPPSMNRTVNGLAGAGWVLRSRAAGDARKVLVSITPAGREIIRETRRLRTEWFSERLGELGADERRALERAVPVLRRITES